MSRLKGPMLLLLAFVVQLSLSAAWPAWVVFFDLPLLVVIYYAMHRGPAVGLALGGAVGLLQDGLTGSLLGVGALSRSVVGYLTGTAVMRFVLSGPLARLLVVGSATLATRLFEIFTLAVMGRTPSALPASELLAGVAGNALLGTILFSMLQRERAV
jgi:rod shape-determining protein MreD